MTALPSSFYQFFGANSQDQRQRVDHLVHKRRVDVQMSNDRDESSPPPKTASDGLPGRDTTRWTARRKVAVVEAVLGGVIGPVVAKHTADAWCIGFAHQQAPEIPLFLPNAPRTATDAVNEF